MTILLHVSAVELAQKNPFFAKVLRSQKDFAQRGCPRPAQPSADRCVGDALLEEAAVTHYWKK